MGLIATVELSEVWYFDVVFLFLLVYCNHLFILLQANQNDVAWQRFLPDGVIALLPLSSNLSSIVWSTDTKSVKNLLQLPEPDFVDAVNQAFVMPNYRIYSRFKIWKCVPYLFLFIYIYMKQCKRFPRNQLVDNTMKAVDAMIGRASQTVKQLPPRINGVYQNSRAGFPLGFGHSSSYVGKGVALIGWVMPNLRCVNAITTLCIYYSDAAHRIHPLAGMGLNLGFGDVKYLTEVLAKASYGGFSLGKLPSRRHHMSYSWVLSWTLQISFKVISTIWLTTKSNDWRPIYQLWWECMGCSDFTTPILARLYCYAALASS